MTTPPERAGRWIAIVGTREDGRPEVTRRLADALASADIRVGGFVQSPCFEGDEVSGYDIVRSATGERMPLARESTEPELCSWSFSRLAFTQAKTWALEGVVPFLEVGRLEAAERGHWDTLMATLASPRLAVVDMRRGVLGSIALRLPDPVDALELPAEPAEIDEFITRVVEHHAQEGCA